MIIRLFSKWRTGPCEVHHFAAQLTAYVLLPVVFTSVVFLNHYGHDWWAIFVAIVYVPVFVLAVLSPHAPDM